MPASLGNADEPTIDPVERERQLLFGDQPQTPPKATPRPDFHPQPRKWTFLTRLTIAVLLAFAAVYMLFWAQMVHTTGGPEDYVRITDFMSTLTGATIVSEGHGTQLYDLDVQRDVQYRVRGHLAKPGDNILPYNHLPFEALVIAPLMGLPYPLIFALWILLAGFAIGMSLGLMESVLPVPRPLGWVLSIALCSYFPVIRSLILGQNSALVLLGLCGTYAALKQGRPGWAGAALVLVTLKPQVVPVVLLLLLLQRHWKTLLMFVTILYALSVAAMPVLGVRWPLHYASLLMGVSAWEDPGAINPAIMHNWRGFSANLFDAWATGLVTPFYVVLSLLTVGLIVSVWSRTREASSQPVEHPYQPGNDLLWALGGIAAVLVSPHLNPHDLTLLVFPAWIIAAYAVSGLWGKELSRLWLGILWAGYLVIPLTAVAVVPNVALLAVALALLAWQLGSRRVAKTGEVAYA